MPIVIPATLMPIIFAHSFLQTPDGILPMIVACLQPFGNVV